jgi:hypothetical protein
MSASRSLVAEVKAEFGEFPFEVVVGGVEVGIAASGQFV